MGKLKLIKGMDYNFYKEVKGKIEHYFYDKNRSKVGNSMMLVKVLFIPILTLTSCSLSKHSAVKEKDVIWLNKENYSKLNGNYYNCPDTTVRHIESFPMSIETLSLWSNINRISAQQTKDINGQWIKVNCPTPNILLIELCDSNGIIRKTTINGRFKKGYFYKQPYFICAPFIPILFGYTIDRYRIGLTESTLTIDNRSSYWWFFLIAGGYKKLNASSTYHRR